MASELKVTPSLSTVATHKAEFRLVGNNLFSSISSSYATGSVGGGNEVGGLVGINDNSSSITNSYATGSVSGTGNGSSSSIFNNRPWAGQGSAIFYFIIPEVTAPNRTFNLRLCRMLKCGQTSKYYNVILSASIVKFAKFCDNIITI